MSVCFFFPCPFPPPAPSLRFPGHTLPSEQSDWSEHHFNQKDQELLANRGSTAGLFVFHVTSILNLGFSSLGDALSL